MLTKLVIKNLLCMEIKLSCSIFFIVLYQLCLNKTKTKFKIKKWHRCTF